MSSLSWDLQPRYICFLAGGSCLLDRAGRVPSLLSLLSLLSRVVDLFQPPEEDREEVLQEEDRVEDTDLEAGILSVGVGGAVGVCLRDLHQAGTSSFSMLAWTLLW